MTTKQNQKNLIIRPMGPKAIHIEIFADNAGIMQVWPWVIDPVTGQKKAMDPGQMCLILQKIVLDTTAGIFSNSLIPIAPENKPDGETNSNNDESI